MNNYCGSCGNYVGTLSFCAGCGQRVRKTAAYGTNQGSNAGQLGVDVTDGDLTVGLGNGLAIDVATGEVELQIFPGVDIPLD